MNSTKKATTALYFCAAHVITRDYHYFVNHFFFVQFFSQIQNVESQNCLDTMGRKANEPIGSSYCHGLGGNQVFAYTKRHQIMSDDNCLDAAHPRGPVKLVRCHGMGGNQEWIYDNEVRVI